MHNTKDNWFQEMFIDEAKTALNKNASPTDAQVEAALFKLYPRFEMGMSLTDFVNDRGAAGEYLKSFPISTEMMEAILSAKAYGHPVNLVFTEEGNVGRTKVTEVMCQAIYFCTEEDGAEPILRFYVLNPLWDFKIEVYTTSMYVMARYTA